MLIIPVLLLLALLFMKAFQLSVTFDDWRSLDFVRSILEPDYYVIGIILIISVLVIRFQERYVPYVISHILLIVLLSLFALDTALFVHLNASLNWPDLQKYVTEWQAIYSFLGWKYLLLLFIIPVWNRRVALADKSQIAIVLSGVFFILGGLLTESTHKTLSDLLPWSQTFSNEDTNRYSAADLWKNIHAEADTALDDLLLSGRNIVLVVIESLSAEDSLRTSGLTDRLPNFDKLSRKGVLFDNFIANYSDTEGGLVSLLTGAPPTPFPGGTRNLYHSFRHRSSLVNTFNNHGYHTEFLTTGPLSFLSKGTFLRDLGITKVQGQKEVRRFSDAPKGSFDSAADGYLYDEAIETIRRLNQTSQSYFLTLLTVTSHRPPRDPDGRGNNQDNVWEYVDRKLHEFYKQLRKNKYFKNGILIVTSDHRKMYPVPFEASEHYGQSVAARIPLVVIGPGIPRGYVDHRLFQQSDLLRKLKYVNNKDAVLTILATYVERYTMHYTETASYGQLIIIDEEGRSYTAHVQGNQFFWDEDIPTKSTLFENELHALRSADQYMKDFSELSWNPVFDNTQSKISKDHKQHGVLARIYKGVDIDNRLTKHSPRYLGERQIKDIDYRGDINKLFDESVAKFSLQLTGKILIPTAGNYWFRIESDDGAGLAIDQKVVIDADYPKGLTLEDGVVFLEEGMHSFELRYFQDGGAAGLRLSWKRSDDDSWQLIPSEYFFLSN